MTTFDLSTTAGCLQFAIYAHRGQLDKQGAPYFLHVARVGAALWAFGPDHVSAGFLHDVVEDTDYALWDLELLGAPAAVLSAVDACTKTSSEADLTVYEASIRRAMEDPVGRWVKAADVSDNASRVDEIPWGPVQVRLRDKYEMAERVIREYLPDYRIGASLTPRHVHLTPV